MKIIPFLIKELEHEVNTTRKFFKLVPEDKFTWKPHEKSMEMKRLCVHIAELPTWIDLAINTDGINFATGDYKPTEVSSGEELINLLDQSEKKAIAALESVKDEDELLKTWTLKNGDTLLQAMTKYEAVRHAYSQTTHHRAQLGVYLRLLNIPIPGSYGPSADEQSF